MSINATTGNFSVSASQIQALDIETALMAIQNGRASLLEDQLKSQLDDVKARNENISNLNQALSAGRTLSGSLGTKDDQKIEKTGKNKEEWNNFEKLATAFGIDTSKVTNKAQLDKAIENLKSKIDGESNSQQMDMLRLQSLSNKRNEAFDVMTNFIKKMQDSRSSIIGNMRWYKEFSMSNSMSISSNTVSSMSLSGLDIETAMAAVQSTRANLLENQLKSQMESVQQKNEQMASINEHMNQLRLDLASLESQIPVKQDLETAIARMEDLLTKCKNPDQWIGISNVWGGDDPQASIEMEQMLKDLGIDTSGIKDIDANGTRDASNPMIKQFISDLDSKLDSLKNLDQEITAKKTEIENSKTQIDNLSNSQQMEMLRLQSLSNKRNEAFDLMSNFIKKMQDNRSSIIGNMR